MPRHARVLGLVCALYYRLASAATGPCFKMTANSGNDGTVSCSAFCAVDWGSGDLQKAFPTAKSARCGKAVDLTGDQHRDCDDAPGPGQRMDCYCTVDCLSGTWLMVESPDILKKDPLHITCPSCRVDSCSDLVEEPVRDTRGYTCSGCPAGHYIHTNATSLHNPFICHPCLSGPSKRGCRCRPHLCLD